MLCHCHHHGAKGNVVFTMVAEDVYSMFGTVTTRFKVKCHDIWGSPLGGPNKHGKLHLEHVKVRWGCVINSRSNQRQNYACRCPGDIVAGDKQA